MEQKEKLVLKTIKVENFRSLKKSSINFKDFNVIIGPNASGKSNIVEIFRLVKEVLDPESINPFSRYWGYQNAVWQHNEELPIKFEFIFEKGFEYSITFSGIGGKLEILKEKIQNDTWEISAVGNKILAKSKGLRYTVEKDVARSIIPAIYKYIYLGPGLWTLEEKVHNSVTRMRSLKRKKRDEILESFRSLLEFPMFLSGFFYRNTIIKPLPKLAKNPTKVAKQWKLEFNCENLQSVLYSIYSKKAAFPEDFIRNLNLVFPDVEKIFPQFTEDGRVFIVVIENGVQFLPNDLSDGFYKVLSILAALELDSSQIIIEELENAVHPQALEILVDALKTSGRQVIITTHSPAVLDVVDPDDLIVVNKEGGETKVSKIKSHKKLKNKLDELGMTLGESWLLGGIED